MFLFYSSFYLSIQTKSVRQNLIFGGTSKYPYTKLMRKLSLPFAIVLSSTTFASETDIVVIIMSLASQVFALGNLLVVIALMIGLFCLYKCVDTLINRNDEQRNPLSAVPFYFIGAAAGIGFGVSSDFIQNTFFGSSNSYKTEAVFEATSLPPSKGSQPPTTP